MSQVLDFSAQFQKNSIAGLKPGCTVRVHQKIVEGEKTRVQVFEGLVIKTNSGSHADATFTVRKVVDGVGVEKIFPLHSPNIAKIEIKKIAKVRRGKLYYMRDRRGKSASLKETHVDIVSEDMAAPADAAPVPDAEGQEASDQPATDAPAEAPTEAPVAEEAAPEAAPAEETKEAPAEEAPTEAEEGDKKE